MMNLNNKAKSEVYKAKELSIIQDDKDYSDYSEIISEKERKEIIEYYKQYLDDGKLNEFSNNLFNETCLMFDTIYDWDYSLPPPRMPVISEFIKLMYNEFHMIHSMNGIMFDSYGDDTMIMLMLFNGDYQYIDKFLDSMKGRFEEEYHSPIHKTEHVKKLYKNYVPNPFACIVPMAIYRKLFYIVEDIVNHSKKKPIEYRDDLYGRISSTFREVVDDENYHGDNSYDEYMKIKDLRVKYRDLFLDLEL